MNSLIAVYADGREIEISLPANWDELNRKQFAQIAAVYYSCTVADVLAFCSQLFIGKKLFREITGEDNQHELLIGVQFIAMGPKFCNSFYKGFKLFGKRYFGVDDELETITLLDFGIADTALLNSEQDKKLLDTFYSIVYNRGIFNFLPLSKKKKAAIRLNFEGLKANLPERFPFLKAGKKESSKAPDYHGLIIGMSGDIFGTRAQTEQEPLFNVLKKLQLDAEAAERNKKPE